MVAGCHLHPVTNLPRGEFSWPLDSNYAWSFPIGKLAFLVCHFCRYFGAIAMGKRLSVITISPDNTGH